MSAVGGFWQLVPISPFPSGEASLPLIGGKDMTGELGTFHAFLRRLSLVATYVARPRQGAPGRIRGGGRDVCHHEHI